MSSWLGLLKLRLKWPITALCLQVHLSSVSLQIPCSVSRMSCAEYEWMMFYMSIIAESESCSINPDRNIFFKSLGAVFPTLKCKAMLFNFYPRAWRGISKVVQMENHCRVLKDNVSEAYRILNLKKLNWADFGHCGSFCDSVLKHGKNINSTPTCHLLVHTQSSHSD